MVVKKSLIGTAPSNKELLAGMVPVNNIFLCCILHISFRLIRIKKSKAFSRDTNMRTPLRQSVNKTNYFSLYLIIST